MFKKRTLTGIIVTNLIGLGFLLLVVLLLNTFLSYMSVPFLKEITIFLNKNLGYIVMSSILFLFGEIFHFQKFPYDLPAPLFNAFGSIFVVKIFYNLAIVFEGYLPMGVLRWLFVALYPTVFVITLIVGYVKIFSQATKKSSRQHRKKHDLLNEYANVQKTKKRPKIVKKRRRH